MKHITVTYEDGISYRIIPMGSMTFYASMCKEGDVDEPLEFVGSYSSTAQALDGIEKHHTERETA